MHFDRMNVVFSRYVLVILVLAAWEILSVTTVLDPILFPPPSSIFLEMIRLIINGDFLSNFAPSFKRILSGLIIGIGIGVPIGLLLGWFKLLYNFFSFFIDFLRGVSALLLITFAIIWFGTNDTARIFVLSYGVFFTTLLNTLNGVLSTDMNLINAARSMGASTWMVVKRVLLPSALPSILTGIRLAISIAWVVLVAVEMVAASSGLGFMVLLTLREFQIKQMYAYTLFIALLAYLMNITLLYLARKILSWRKESTLGIF